MRVKLGHTTRPAGAAVPERVMVPAKLKLLLTLILTETPVCPVLRLTPVTVIVKSPTCIVVGPV
jgi:hypothetical protein